jgi:hypothetical protein
MEFKAVIRADVCWVLANRASGRRSLGSPKRTHLEEKIMMNGAWEVLSVVVTNAGVSVNWVETSASGARAVLSEYRAVIFFYFYRYTVHFEDSSNITHQQMHQYYLLFKIGFNP